MPKYWLEIGMILYYIAQKSTKSPAALSCKKAFSTACAALMCPAPADAERISTLSNILFRGVFWFRVLCDDVGLDIRRNGFVMTQ